MPPANLSNREREIIERVQSAPRTDADLDDLSQGASSRQTAIGEENRSVSVAGDVNKSVVLIGDHNKVIFVQTSPAQEDSSLAAGGPEITDSEDASDPTMEPEPSSRQIFRGFHLLIWIVFHPAKWIKHPSINGLKLPPSFSLSQLGQRQWSAPSILQLLNTFILAVLLVIVGSSLSAVMIAWVMNFSPDEKSHLHMNLGLAAALSLVTGLGLSIRIGLAAGFAATMLSGMCGAFAAVYGVSITTHGSVAGGVTGGISVGAAFAVSLNVARSSAAKQIHPRPRMPIWSVVTFVGLKGSFIATFLIALGYGSLVVFDGAYRGITSKTPDELDLYMGLLGGTLFGYGWGRFASWSIRKMSNAPASTVFDHGIWWTSAVLGALAATPGLLQRPSVFYGIAMGILAGIVLAALVTIPYALLETRINRTALNLISPLIAFLTLRLLFYMNLFKGLPEKERLLNLSFYGSVITFLTP